MKKNIEEHEDEYWHIKKVGFRPLFLIIYFITTTISILWITFDLDNNKSILVVPMIILTLGIGYGWIACLNKIYE